MISMATDEMIRLVAMYPDVWFMDTTAGKGVYFPCIWIQWRPIFCQCLFIELLSWYLFLMNSYILFNHEFIYSMNSINNEFT